MTAATSRTIDRGPLTFTAIVDRWKVYSRRDAIERYEIMAEAAEYVAYHPGDRQRLADAMDLRLWTFSKYLRIVQKISRDEAEKLISKGYGWSHFCRLAERAGAQAIKQEALTAKHTRVIKADLNTRRTGARGGWNAPRDGFISALAAASPAQVGNWTQSYLQDSCTPARRDAIIVAIEKALAAVKVTP